MKGTFDIVRIRHNTKAKGQHVRCFGEDCILTGKEVKMTTSSGGSMWWREMKDKQGHILYG